MTALAPSAVLVGPSSLNLFTMNERGSAYRTFTLFGRLIGLKRIPASHNGFTYAWLVLSHHTNSVHSDQGLKIGLIPVCPLITW